MSIDRAQLRKVFDKFDVDGSGSVSTSEMTKMLKMLKVEKSPAEVGQMMKDADPDGSGEVDFEEFVSALQKGGEMTNVFSGAANFFGFLNPMSWFGGGEETPAPPPPAPKPKVAASAPPKAAASEPVAPPSSSSAAVASPPVAAPAAPSGGFFDYSPPAAASAGPAGGTSLFDQYASSGAPSGKKSGHQWTRTVRLRSNGIKLNCYVNTEVNCGRATVISLPEDCDTLAEVMPKVQQCMQLDKRLMYAAELYLPDGQKINTFEDLEKAARLSTAIIVGCGEPFDPTSIPFDILQFFKEGGGRSAAKKVKHILQEKKKEEALDKADTVRASGHGLTPVAVITSRNANVETNREQANIQRHEYMEQLMYRAAQEKELMDRVQQNNAMHKLEQEEARARKAEYERERFEMLAYQRQLQKEEAERKKAEMKSKMDAMHKKVKGDFENSAFYIKSKKMANISRAGSSKGVKI